MINFNENGSAEPQESIKIRQTHLGGGSTRPVAGSSSFHHNRID